VTSGIVDLHVHSGPSLLPRHTDDPATAASARRAGIEVFVLKAHEGTTAERALLLGGGAVGGIVLNSPVGGANPDAVRVAARLGARVAWLPTISSPAHQRANRSPELSVHRGVAFATVPICDGATLSPTWLPVFEEVAAADMVLASGHATIDEAITAFAAAQRVGVRRFLVNHPLMPFLGWRDEQADALRALGAHLEVGVLPDLLAAGDDAVTAHLVRVYPPELLVFGSDLGHSDYPTLDDGIASWVARCEPVVGEAVLARIMSANGAALVAA
jgi:hypothetical protein